MSAKYFRTFHLPYSPGGTDDDKRLKDDRHFYGPEIVLTEKMDGGNCCMTRDTVYARSHSKLPAHPSFDPLKALHAKLRHELAKEYSYFGEWCFAVHSIEYTALPAYFMLFAVRDDERDMWLSWNHVEFHAQKLGLVTVPLLWSGYLPLKGDHDRTLSIGLQDMIETATLRSASKAGATNPEGVVVRLADSFQDPSISVAKWVRANHVQTDEHWTRQAFRKNQLEVL